jgi:glycosyltransferase involved in cell wall biosynthesis
MNKGPIIILLDNEYRPDSRVENELNALCDSGFVVEMHCMKSQDLPKLENAGNLTIYRDVSEKLYRPFSKEYRSFTKEFTIKISALKPSIIHCHDFRMFFLACEIKKVYREVKIIYDSHEYLMGYPYFYRTKSWSSKFKGFFVWAYYVYCENRDLKKADAIITVSNALLNKLKKRSGKPALLLRNIPPNSKTCKQHCHYWHDLYKLPLDTKIVVHTGNAHYSTKRIHFLFDEFKKRKNLALVFLGTNKSIDNLKQICTRKGISNIYFHEQIPRKFVTYYCSQANIGLVYTWNKIWISYWYALPNKLIDVSLSGIPVLSTNQPELAHFIDTYQHGVTFDGTSQKALSTALDRILENEATYKKQAEKIETKLTWDTEKQGLIDLYKKLKH